MELCQYSLQDYLDQRTEINEHYSLHVFMQILLGVGHLHREHKMHRDLKPSNIFICSSTNQINESNSNIVKIGDFSLSVDDIPFFYPNQFTALDEPDKGLTETDQDKSGIVTTYAYASPELRRGAQCDQSTDIFSIGVILFELFCVCTPSSRDRTFKDLRRRVLPATVLLNYPTVAAVVLWLISPDPPERPNVPKILESKLFDNYKAVPEHVVIAKKELEDMDKRIQSQESKIHLQENIIKEQEKKIKALMSEGKRK